MYAFRGTHLLLDYYNVDPVVANDINYVEVALRNSIQEAGFTLINIVSSKFEPQGLSTVALLEESHVSIHTYPEKKSMFIDIFTCGDGVPDDINRLLSIAFKPHRINITKIIRGE